MRSDLITRLIFPFPPPSPPSPLQYALVINDGGIAIPVQIKMSGGLYTYAKTKYLTMDDVIQAVR